jgi:hypothetical protein
MDWNWRLAGVAAANFLFVAIGHLVLWITLIHNSGEFSLDMACEALQAWLLACPFCSTETSQQVRASIFNDDFWTNAALILSPFAVLVFGALVVHRFADRK